MIEALLRDLRQPEYVHTLLNPLPVYGLAVALLGLVLSLIFRSSGGRVTSLTLIFLSAAAVWPVVEFGERAEDNVLSISDDDGRAWLEAHAARADRLKYVYYALAAVTAAALIAPRRWQKSTLPLGIATALLAIVSLGAGASIAYAGGKIRHREFRTVPPPKSQPER